MNESLTAVFEKSLYGYIGYVEELPGANTQKERRWRKLNKTLLKPFSLIFKRIVSSQKKSFREKGLLKNHSVP